MTDSPRQGIGFARVFADELTYLRRRRRIVHGDEAAREAEEPEDGRSPSTEHELVGLALSGGGLGSSTFQLGALEELDRNGVFAHVDYLSTVSSGGFVGATLSTAMRDGGEFPFREAAGGRQSPYLSWLRSGLADTWRGGLVSYGRSFGGLLRGMLGNLLVLLPILWVLATAIVWLKGGDSAVWEANEQEIAQKREELARLTGASERAQRRAVGGGADLQRKADEALQEAEAAAQDLKALQSRIANFKLAYFKWTIVLAGLFLFMVLLQPALLRAYESFGQSEGEEASSAESRQSLERVFGLLIFSIVLAAWIESQPAGIRWFHKLEGTGGFREAYVLFGGTVALAVSAAAGKVLSKLSGLRQRIALILMALLWLALPTVVGLYVADGLIYIHPEGPGALAEAREFAAERTPYYLSARALLPPLELRNSFGVLLTLPGILLLVMGGGAGAAAVGRVMGRSRLRSVVTVVGILIGGACGYAVMVGGSQLLAAISNRMGVPGIRSDWLTVAAAAVAFLFAWGVLDVNLTSSLGLYRDRLASLFLIGMREDRGTRRPCMEADYALSELSGGARNESRAPYHLLNAAVNLQGSKDPLRRGSHEAFVFSKHYCGGSRTGFCRTEQLERIFPQVDFPTAMTISAARVTPNASRLTSKPLIAMATMLNMRLGYWAPNPRRLEAWLKSKKIAAPELEHRWNWRVPPWALLREMAGWVGESQKWVNLSDGGNVDDTGAYELLRRRCKFVVLVDGAPDPEHAFGSLIRLRRRAQLDLGVDIALSLEGLRPDRNGRTRRHAAAGRILYPPAQEGGEPETGYLLYVRPALTGDEDDLVTERRAGSPDFPHERTAAGGVDDRQFSAYRALGLHSVAGLFESPPRDGAASRDFRGFKAWFQGLDERLTPKGIFISYRRADASGHALLIHRALERRFPSAEVFLDVGGIEPGEEFTAAIEETLDRARITLVLIGNQWLGLTDADGRRRLDDPEDTVRSEISMSFRKGKRVIPLLVEQTPMPTEHDLPEELRPLAYQNAVNLTHARFDSDLETLMRVLETFLD